MASSFTHVLKSKRCLCRFARGRWATAARAVRPLAASAPAAVLEAWQGSSASSVSSPFSTGSHCAGPSGRQRSLPIGRNSLQVCPARSEGRAAVQALASRSSARQSQEGRASTRCFAARAGGLRLLASGVTHRKMQIRAVPCAPPNPSIERTRSLPRFR